MQSSGSIPKIAQDYLWARNKIRSIEVAMNTNSRTTKTKNYKENNGSMSETEKVLSTDSESCDEKKRLNRSNKEASRSQKYKRRVNKRALKVPTFLFSVSAGGLTHASGNCRARELLQRGALSTASYPACLQYTHIPSEH